MNKDYYAVTCKCGHVGRNQYILITFPIIAESGKEAAMIARLIPRVKHHHKDCIIGVRKIDYEEFVMINKLNSNDPYLSCGSIQEQRLIDLSERVYSEITKETVVKEAEYIHVLYDGKIKIRNPKKFIRFNNCIACSYE